MGVSKHVHDSSTAWLKHSLATNVIWWLRAYRHTSLTFNKTRYILGHVRTTVAVVEKTISVTYSGCVSSALDVRHAMRLYRTIFSLWPVCLHRIHCGLSVCTVFIVTCLFAPYSLWPVCLHRIHCHLSVCTVFIVTCVFAPYSPTLFKKGTIFGKCLLHIKCALILHTHFVRHISHFTKN